MRAVRLADGFAGGDSAVLGPEVDLEGVAWLEVVHAGGLPVFLDAVLWVVLGSPEDLDGPEGGLVFGGGAAAG